jgi:uncharacterized protein
MPNPTLFLLLLALVWASGSVQAQSAVPALTGRVVDTADILSPETEARLAEQLAAAEDSTGAQVAVLTVPALQSESIEELAVRVFNTWGLGDAARDDGVLLLIARDDRELRIEVGYGLEGQITDSRAGRVIRDVIVPRFRDGDFDGGVSDGVSAITGLLDGTYSLPEGGGSGSDHPPWPIALIFSLTHVLLPAFIGLRALLTPGCARYPAFLFTFMFVVPTSFFLLPNGWVVGLLYVFGWIALDIWLGTSERGKAKREAAAEAIKKGVKTKMRLGPVAFTVGGKSSGGGFGGSSGGGGFSGGGGSSGGGGASGSW